jgi:hypothetical protein
MGEGGGNEGTCKVLEQSLASTKYCHLFMCDIQPQQDVNRLKGLAHGSNWAFVTQIDGEPATWGARQAVLRVW